MSIRRRRRIGRLPWQFAAALEHYASLPESPSAPEIQRRLEETWPDLADRVPHVKTIQKRIRELQVPMRDPWSVATAEPEEASLVLPVAAERMRQAAEMGVDLRGGIEVDVNVARWIAHVRIAAPDIPLLNAYDMAVRYRRAEIAGARTRHLDAFMALAPWRSKDEFAELDAISKGLLSPMWQSADLLALVPTNDDEEDQDG